MILKLKNRSKESFRACLIWNVCRQTRPLKRHSQMTSQTVAVCMVAESGSALIWIQDDAPWIYTSQHGSQELGNQ